MMFGRNSADMWGAKNPARIVRDNIANNNPEDWMGVVKLARQFAEDTQPRAGLFGKFLNDSFSDAMHREACLIVLGVLAMLHENPNLLKRKFAGPANFGPLYGAQIVQDELPAVSRLGSIANDYLGRVQELAAEAGGSRNILPGSLAQALRDVPEFGRKALSTMTFLKLAEQQVGPLTGGPVVEIQAAKRPGAPAEKSAPTPVAQGLLELHVM